MESQIPTTFDPDAGTLVDDDFLTQLAGFDQPGWPCLRMATEWNRLDSLARSRLSSLRQDVMGHARNGCPFCTASMLFLPGSPISEEGREVLDFVLGEALAELREFVRDTLVTGNDEAEDGGGRDQVAAPAAAPARPKIAASAGERPAKRWSVRERPTEGGGGATIRAAPYFKAGSSRVFEILDAALAQLDERWRERLDLPGEAIDRLDRAALGPGGGILIESSGLWALHLASADLGPVDDTVERLVRAFAFLVQGYPDAARGEAAGLFAVVEV